MCNARRVQQRHGPCIFKSRLTLVTLPTLPLSAPLMIFTVSPVFIGIGNRTGLPLLVSL